MEGICEVAIQDGEERVVFRPGDLWSACDLVSEGVTRGSCRNSCCNSLLVSDVCFTRVPAGANWIHCLYAYDLLMLCLSISQIIYIYICIYRYSIHLELCICRYLSIIWTVFCDSFWLDGGGSNSLMLLCRYEGRFAILRCVSGESPPAACADAAVCPRAMFVSGICLAGLVVVEDWKRWPF